MSDQSFDKYPKITAINKHALPAGPVQYVLQHKLDGAQAGIERRGAALLVHSRNTLLATLTAEGGKQEGGNNAGFSGLVTLVSANFDELLAYMMKHDLKHIYGEWLVPHTVKYAEGMYRKFYVYDLVRDGGRYLDPVSFVNLKNFGFELITRMAFEGINLTHSQVRTRTLEMQAHLGYPIEGAVLKSYELDAQNFRDRFGNRFIYKDVLPEFHEEKGTPQAAHAPKPTEEAMALSLPVRTIEKRLVDAIADNGGTFEGKLYPQVVGRVWADFVTEIFDACLRDLKYPVVNTRELKRLVDQRTRTFIQNYEVAA